MDLFRLLPSAGRRAVLARARLNAANRELLLQHVGSEDEQDHRAVFRKFQKLAPADRANLAARAKTLDRAGQSMVRSVLARMSVYDKKDRVEGLTALPEPRRRALLALLEALDRQVSGTRRRTSRWFASRRWRRG